MTTVIHCVRGAANEVQLKTPLFNPNSKDMNELITQLKTFRPKFQSVDFFRDGDTGGSTGTTMCVVTLPPEADRDEVANAQKAVIGVLEAFYPDNDIQLEDHVLH